MRKRPKYYYIETFVYDEGCITRKNHYFFTNLRDFRKELFRIISLGNSNIFLNCEYIRNACILPRTSSLYWQAHEELSKAYADGYTSVCVFYEYDIDYLCVD